MEGQAPVDRGGIIWEGDAATVPSWNSPWSGRPPHCMQYHPDPCRSPATRMAISSGKRS